MKQHALRQFSVLALLLSSRAVTVSAANCTDQKQPPEFPSATSISKSERSVSLRQLVPNILCDQKNIWLFPVRTTHDHNWIPTLGVVGGAAGLLLFDPTEARYFHQTSSFSGFNRAFSSTNTELATIMAPAAMYIAGWARKDTEMTRTALLSGEAALDSEIVVTVLKNITDRKRPYSFATTDNYSDSFYDHNGSKIFGGGGFPSGHAIAAFSIATVIAHQYRSQHRWVPYVAYGAATAIGLSRLSLSQHFGSDVFVGAALGYSISRFAVLRY